MRRLVCTAFVVAGIVSLGGCGAANAAIDALQAAPATTPPVNPNGPGGPDLQEPAPSTAPTTGFGPGPAAGFGGAPQPSPTVAKTQKWVKIFSGPSDTDIAAPANRDAQHTVELNATPSGEIGTYVADGAGRTLYRFDDDPAKKSVCNGDCAVAWPPLLIKSPGKIFPSGIDPQRIGYIERADHHCQVTIDGHPLYYFVADNAAGQLNGQGINGKWFAIAPGGGRTSAIPDRPLR